MYRVEIKCAVTCNESYRSSNEIGSLSAGTASTNFQKKNTSKNGFSARAVPAGVSPISFDPLECIKI